MDRRRLLLACLFGAVATALAASPVSAAVTASLQQAPLPQPNPSLATPDEREALLNEVQYGPPRRGRRPRCRIQRQRVPVRDRHGRTYYRWVDRRVCR